MALGLASVEGWADDSCTDVCRAWTTSSRGSWGNTPFGAVLRARPAEPGRCAPCACGQEWTHDHYASTGMQRAGKGEPGFWSCASQAWLTLCCRESQEVSCDLTGHVCRRSALLATWRLKAGSGVECVTTLQATRRTQKEAGEAGHSLRCSRDDKGAAEASERRALRKRGWPAAVQAVRLANPNKDATRGSGSESRAPQEHSSVQNTRDTAGAIGEG